MNPMVILGCGYVGARIARTALAAGRKVRVCARSTGRLAPLAALGAEVKYLDAGIIKQLPLAVASMHGATVVFSIPPITALPPGQAMRGALQAAYGAGANCFIYLSSAGLYGALPDDDVWIDEDSPVAHDDPPMANVMTDEAAIDSSSFERMRIVTLRLAPVYGPGRGLRERIRAGQFKILDEGQHVTSRIHVDDVVSILLAAEERAEHKSRFLLADDEPTTQGEYTRWLCERMGLPLPASRSIYEPGAQRVAHRNRKVKNALVKRALGVELRYPSFREGEAAIEAELAG
ncbi:MAG: NAD-dependent epimerase/dehydratase family protein [Proteobacteria bacterium]|nr:NAD-dependent epimerase/dehydratase family protein [Pseudomonadota bacterium]